MPRAPRQVVAGLPLHVTQRGVDRQRTFIASEDYVRYLDAARDAASTARCAVHAYVLMTNHIHLLVTPEDASGPARLMCSLGRQYVPYFNHRYGRTGTLWEGRYRSALVTSPAYFFACSRYIEANPVRAGLTDDPREYRWSSARANLEGIDDPVVTHHALYRSLGSEPAARCAAYRAMLDAVLPPGVVASLRTSPRGAPPLRPSLYRRLLDAGAAAADGVGREPRRPTPSIAAAPSAPGPWSAR